jgi:hypothetical protein
MRKTPCIDPTKPGDHEFTDTRISHSTLYTARHDVTERFLVHMTADRVDARLDCSFGLVLYGLDQLYPGDSRLGRVALVTPDSESQDSESASAECK